MKKQYEEALKKQNLSVSFVEMGQQLRKDLDAAGGTDKILVLAGDGSFVTAPVLEAFRNARFCWSAPAKMRGCAFMLRRARGGFMT
jgi:hypothetical protein